MYLANSSISIVMYHYIKERKLTSFKNFKFLEYSDFQSQINFFEKNFNIISFDDFKSIIKNKKFPKKPSILLTFDDGYSDHYQYVFPLLFKKKINACFFSPTSIFKKNYFLEVNKIHIILDKFQDKNKLLKLILAELKKISDIDIDKLMTNLFLEVKNSTHRFDDKKTLIVKYLLQHSIPNKYRVKLVKKLFEIALLKSKETDIENFYINKKNFLEMAKNGMHFGSHGHSHLKFDKLNLAKAEKEIKDSLKNFDALGLSKKIETLCYPYGNYDRKTIGLLKKYNIKYGFTIRPGSILSESNISNYELPRYDTNDFK